MSGMTMGASSGFGENGGAAQVLLARWQDGPWSREQRERVLDDKLDVALEDAELLAEVELTTNLIIAASEADSPFAQDELDRLLGIERPSIPTQQIRDTS